MTIPFSETNGMTVLSLDPSIQNLGYAVFRNQSLLLYGCHKTSPWGALMPLPQRLGAIHRYVEDLCSRWQPATVVVEDYIFRRTDARRMKALKLLIMAIGAVILSVPANVRTVTYYPAQWKGSKKKATTLREAKAVYSIKGKLDPNAADAIMMGHHYIQSLRQTSLVLERKERRGR